MEDVMPDACVLYSICIIRHDQPQLYFCENKILLIFSISLLEGLTNLFGDLSDPIPGQIQN